MTTSDISRDVRTALSNYPAGLYVALAVGALLRLYGLGAEDYWIDEFRSLQYVATRSPIEVALEIPFFDPHPPLYYVVLDLWTSLVGVSEPAVRLLSAIFGIAAIPLVYLVGAQLYDQRVGVLSAGILALSQFHVRFSQTARMYSLLVFATLLSMDALLRLRANPTRRTTGWYLLATVVLVYSHVFGVLVVAAQHCYVLGSRFVRADGTWAVDPRRWLAVHLAVAALAIPWGVGIGQQAMTLVTSGGSGGSGLAWIPDPTPMRLVSAVGGYLTPSIQNGFAGLLVLIVVGLLALGSQSRVPLDRERTLLLGCWLAVPVLGLFVASYLLVPLFVARYTSAALPAVALLLAKEIRRIGSVEFRYIAVGLVVLSLVAGFPGYYQQPQYTEWDEAAGTIAGNASESDLVLVYYGHATETFGHYLDGRQSNLTVEGINGTELDAIETGETPPATRDAIADHDDVWVTLTDVGPTRRQHVLDLLERTGYGARNSYEFNRVRVYHYVANGSEG
ncbi:glycosyltransferase family 39 protein [Halorientalis brevis]|uniref:Glycosyltransferase family 39 protein n=1 Tax=Halorientalis brevis TaxID=1126241 RepID=A0ABD6C9T0_9EURY|nr:glycosyltransferase family 39 protein [Halorientalis brevis]